MEFLYTIKNGTVCVDKVAEPGPEVEIPERIAGLPVTELGAYVLSGSDVEEVHIPPQIHKIGAYAFYGCSKLCRFYGYGRVSDLGPGLFADDQKVAFFDLTVFSGERSCFKEMLSELHQTLRVRVHEVEEERTEDGAVRLVPIQDKEARLIFPEYFEESVENTPARKLAVETHGCGQRYRYCFVRREFQYAAYDELFLHVQVQEPKALVAELAIGRLQYPRGLGQRAREQYVAYLKEHWRTAAEVLIQADRLACGAVTNLDPGMLPWLTEEIVGSTREQVNEAAAIAQHAGDTEMVSYLMDYAHRAFGGAPDAGGGDGRGGGRKRRRRFEL